MNGSESALYYSKIIIQKKLYIDYFEKDGDLEYFSWNELPLSAKLGTCWAIE